MAESAVSFLLKQLATLISEEQKLLGGLDEDILYIKRQLELMQAFLRVADAKEDGDDELKTWVDQVRKAAHDAEDVLEIFMLRFAQLHATDAFCGCAQKIYMTIKNYSARRKTACEVCNIKLRVQDIIEKHQSYQRRHGAQLGSSSSSTWFDGRGDALLMEKDMLVGIDEPKEQLINELLDGNPRLKAVSLVGMGGSGKSTLVKSIYDDKQLKAKFQCHAWLNVSQSFNIKELLKDLIRQLHEEIKEPVHQEVESLNNDNLRAFVKDFLSGRKFLLVFDDIWNFDSWDALRVALPNSNLSSRVLLTTRRLDLAKATRSEYWGYVHEMKALTYEESRTLFCNKTFADHTCPEHLKRFADDILEKCEGLPLAIAAVGGLLASKDKNQIEEWKMILSNLNANLCSDEKLERLKKVLLLSYYDLPYYLKTCLLFLSIFPEDHLIEYMRLIRLWTAEGFVQGRDETTKEEVALRYLNELIHRSLIQVAERTADGRVKLCRIHDIIREIVVLKSQEQNVITTVQGTDSISSDKVRRIAVHNSIINSALEVNKFKHLRSLVLSAPVDSLSEAFLYKLLSGGLKLVRVLDLRDSPMDKIPNEVFKLRQLVYLSLRGTKVKVIPKSIGQLQCLETLDLKGTDVTGLPIEILKLRKIRHLLVYKYKPFVCFTLPFDYLQSFKAPYQIGCLTSLQKLCHIEADQMRGTTIVREIGKLTALRKLGINKLRSEDGKDLCSSLEKLTHLRSLSVASLDDCEIIDLQYPLSSTLPFLRSLCIEGTLAKVPQWIASLHALTRVTLRHNKSSDYPLESLQDLPCLADLILDGTFEGEKLVFNAGKFQRLKTLWIWRLKGLKHIVVEKRSMPNLDELYLGHCKLIEELPIGIEHLTKLHYFQIDYMSENFVKALENQKKSEGDQWKLARVPKIFIARIEDGERKWRLL